MDVFVSFSRRRKDRTDSQARPRNAAQRAAKDDVMEESIETIKAGREYWHNAWVASEIHGCKLFRWCMLEAFAIVLLSALLMRSR